MISVFTVLLCVLSGIGNAQNATSTTTPAPTPTGNYTGPLRPQVHFSPPTGFMNDPNGLFLADDGTYHMYYQYNPTAVTAGNQHWGHATSDDLYHWTNQPIAISPGNPDEGIFTGSAVIDRNNTSGFFPNQTNGVVAIYTLNTPTSEAQDIAYSTDGGYTFTKYSKNPVIDVGSTQFRDPKVFWYAPTSNWVVVVSYAQDYVIGIWTSPNLRDWQHASNFSHHGLLGLQYECPNLVALPMLQNGSYTTTEDLLSPSNLMADPVWIMFVSINPGAPLGGSISQYFPGSFNGTHFETFDDATRLSDFAKDNYAGQFFAEIPGNEPQIGIQWASNWQYTNDVPTDTEDFRSFMTVPRLTVLGNTTRAPYQLWSLPVPLDPIFVSTTPLAQNMDLSDTSMTVQYGNSTPSGALTFNTTAKNLPAGPNGMINFTISSSSTGESVTGGLFLGTDTTFFIDRSNVHDFVNPFFTEKFSLVHDVDPDTHQFTMQIVVDRSIIEIFLDGGVYSGTVIYFSQGQLDTLVLSSSGLDSGVSVEAGVWGLESIWQSNATSTLGNSSQIVRRNSDGKWPSR